MQFFQRIWNEVRRGENIDLYVTILIAIGLVSLNLTGFAQRPLMAPITLTVLGLLAIAILANRYRLDESLKQLSKLSQNYYSDITIYEHWRVPEVHNILRSAKKSIYIVDTWIGEAITLLGCIGDASRKSREKIIVNFYILSPEKPFGGQRFAEYEGQLEDTKTSWQQKYLKTYNWTITTLQKHSSELDIDMSIYKYINMPSIRLYIIDDEEFVFSWFPADSPSSENVCFHFSETSENKEIHYAAEKLRRHLQGIQKHCKRVDSNIT